MSELTNDIAPKNSRWLYHLDVRFKIVFLVILSMVIINADFLGLLFLFFFQIAVFFSSQISIRKTVKDFRLFFFFLLVIFFIRTLSTTGKNLFDINLFFLELNIAKEGLRVGGLVCFRLFLVVMFGYLFMVTTMPSRVREAVAWFLRPIPLIPENRIATMLGLLMRFLPLIVQQARETVDAQRARGVENRKNPVYRFVKFAIPMLRRIFLRADELILAMEARGYSENRKLRRFSATKSDWLCLIVVITLSLLLTATQI
ncbi:MAG: energy-coupling factor transporter transmembrane component T [Desulfobacterales bacterium]